MNALTQRMFGPKYTMILQPEAPVFLAAPAIRAQNVLI